MPTPWGSPSQASLRMPLGQRLRFGADVAAAAATFAARYVRKVRALLSTLLGHALNFGPCAGALWCAYQAFTLLPAIARTELLKPIAFWHVPTGSVWVALAGWNLITTATLNSALRPALLAYVGLGVGLAILSNVISYARQRPSNLTAWVAVTAWFVALALSLADITWLSGQGWFWRGYSIGGQPAALVLRMAEAGSLIAALCYQMPLVFNRVSPQHAQPVARIMWRLFIESVVAATLIPALWPYFDSFVTPAFRAVQHARSSEDQATTWAILGFYVLIASATIGALALTPLKLLWSVIATLLLTRPLIPREPHLFMPAHRGSR